MKKILCLPTNHLTEEPLFYTNQCNEKSFILNFECYYNLQSYVHYLTGITRVARRRGGAELESRTETE